MSKARLITPRSDTTLNWSTANPILKENEQGVDLDLKLIKIGDGVTLWNDLKYFIPTIPVSLPTYVVAGVPDATLYAGSLIYVSNEVGGSVIAFSDGSNWLRCTDRIIIS